MSSLQITPSIAHGKIQIPSSKSHTLRAILFASMAHGQSCIQRALASPDTTAMLTACAQIGADINEHNNNITITGVNGTPKLPDDVINAGNSGQVLRFIAALCALIPGYSIITGDHSIRYNRPVQPLIEGLTGLHATAVSTKNDGFAPLIINGPILPGVTELDGQDSQPVSALLIACAFANGTSTVKIHNPGEKPWVALTLHWFDKLSIAYRNHDFNCFDVVGNSHINGFDYVVPGDFSTAAFPAVAALISKSSVTLENIDFQDVQGDKQLFSVLRDMGATIDICSTHNTLTVAADNGLHGIDVDINDFVDAVAILAVIGCYATGVTRIRGASIARSKESNRLQAITTELQKMGANIEQTEDGLIIQQSPLHGTKLNSYNDHRIAMALAIAGLGAQGSTQIQAVDCISKTYPHFAQDMRQLGCHIEKLS